MPSRLITDLCEALQPLANQFISVCNSDPLFARAGVEAFITCTYRSSAEQDQLFAKGRTMAGPTVTNARGGESPHNCMEGQKPASRAFDIALRYRGSGNLLWDASSPFWRRATAIGEAIGLDSGSSWGDWPHFQLRHWKKKTVLSDKSGIV